MLAESFLELSEDRRGAAFTQAALDKGSEAAIVEKDFWVCWILGLIFSDQELEPQFVFKGGTSLSKVYGVIERFSEDVDLGIHPAFLGFEEGLFAALESQTKRTGALLDMQKVCGERLEKTVVPRLEAAAVTALGRPSKGQNWFSYSFDERVHGPVVLFQYPSVAGKGVEYIQRAVKLEIGSLTDQRPLGRHPVRPWLADSFPGLFQDWRCEVTALELVRTFWEKATILHAEHHRPAGQEMPVRQARHFSDFTRLLEHPESGTFLADTSMCLRVADWKSRVFARRWAKYELARPGTFKLVPPEARLKSLERDYVAMRPMFLNEPMPFVTMIARLQDAEQRMNAA
jgi:hypothetical protein